MLIEGKNKAKKKARRSNSVRGTQRFTRPSQANGGANIPINSEIAIPKLEKLAQKYIGVSDPYGFLTDLRNTLGIPNSQGASKYGEVTIPKKDGSVLQASLRITNHNSDARTYITHNANYEYNLSILVRKNFAANTFKPHDDVILDEFVYYGKRMEKVENPLSQIVNSIIGFLKDGKYNDTTGIAFKNTSPQTNNDSNNQENINCNRNMNKKLIKLTESDLHRIVKESVSKILNESKEDDRAYIVYDGIKFLLSMNGEDMYIEYTENDRWVLAGYYANEKLWVVQENFREEEVGEGEDNILTIAKTKSMPEALHQLSRYIKYDKSYRAYMGDWRSQAQP